MADLFPVAGATIWIGPAMVAPSTDLTEASFAAVSFTQIKDWTQCGSFGDTAALITTQVIDRSRDVKMAGTDNAGGMPNVFAINVDDPGQLALYAAKAGKRNHPFKIIWDDAPEGGTPTVTMFAAIVMSVQQAGGGPNTVRTLNSNFEINSNIVETPAAA